MELLNKIYSSSDIKALDIKDLPHLCAELRQYIIDEVSVNPGHLGSSLGAVEIAVAIHYVFDTPNDKLVWDVGHQAYPHKILTGRRDSFKLNRKKDGISGFPKMAESEYDAFGVGHSSTSISAIMGMAEAARLQGDEKSKFIAVIGDASIGGGMAFEALNHAGDIGSDIIVILNDNGIAIDSSVGAVGEYLTSVSTSPTYNNIKNKLWNLLDGDTRKKSQTIGVFRAIRQGIKSAIIWKSNLFEALGFRYYGPTDGHNVIKLVKALQLIKEHNGPKLLHVITKKGKGLQQAENNPTTYHAPGIFSKETGEITPIKNGKAQPPKYQTVFGETILELAKQNPKIVGITPAMLSGCSLNIMQKEMPERVFDVGIAEQHAVTFAAGLAANGMTPFCNIYSTFAQRAYDQIIHDVALQRLNVVLCMDRAGIVGEDGATHQGAFDLAFMRLIPNSTIAAPMNEIELRNMLYTAQLPNKGFFSIRYPRGNGVIIDWRKPFKEIEIGKGQLIKDGNDIAIISIGHAGNFALKAAEIADIEGISVAVYDMRFLKPLDEILLFEIFKRFEKIITVEDGTIIGGLGSAVNEFKTQNQFTSEVTSLGIPDKFIEQGAPVELYVECGYDTQSILNQLRIKQNHTTRD